MSNTSDKSNYYLTGEEFFNALVDSKIKGKMTNELAKMFMLLSEKNVNHRNFVGYHHLRGDLIATGQLACVNAFRYFKPYKDKEENARWEENKVPIDFDYKIHNNSFAFFTTCIRHAIFQVLKNEYKQSSNIINELRMQNGLDPSYGYTDMINEAEAKRAEEEGESDVDLNDHLSDDNWDIYLDEDVDRGSTPEQKESSGNGTLFGIR